MQQVVRRIFRVACPEVFQQLLGHLVTDVLSFQGAEETTYHGGDVTVLELVERYISIKTGVRHNTIAGYKTVVNILKKEEFGSRRINLVKPSDAKLWPIKLQSEDKRSYSSIHSIRGRPSCLSYGG